MRRTTALVIIFIFVFIVGAPVLFGTIAWVRITERYKGYTAPEQFVEVPQGASPSEIGRRLVDARVVTDNLTYRTALWWTGASRSLKAGEYRFDRPMTAVQVI